MSLFSVLLIIGSILGIAISVYWVYEYFTSEVRLPLYTIYVDFLNIISFTILMVPY